MIKLVKPLFVLIIVTAFFSFTTEENTINWVSIEEAQASVKENPKAIFIDFSAQWCGWCKVMDKKTFSDETVASYMNENFYPCRLDYDSKEVFEFFGEKYTARQLGEKYKVPGLPTILLISADNKKSKTLVGYKNPDQFLPKLKSFN